MVLRGRSGPSSTGFLAGKRCSAWTHGPLFAAEEEEEFKMIQRVWVPRFIHRRWENGGGDVEWKLRMKNQ